MTEQSRPNVVFLLPALTAGGAERVLITLMNGLDRDAFNPSMICIGGVGPMADFIDEIIPAYVMNSRIKTCLPALYKQLKELQPDIVVSTMAHMNFMALLLKPFFPDTKFIVREAITPSFILQKYKKSSLLLKIAYRILYKRAEIVLSPAQAIIDEFASLGISTENHRVLCNPVDSAMIRKGTLPLREEHDVTEYICVGRLHPQKGYDRLLETIPGRIEKKWHLTFLGDGPEKRRLEIQATKLGIDDFITMAGHIEEPWPYMAVADCLLLPSRWEGLPNVVLESLAAGTPVVATAESGGIREIAEKAPRGAVTVSEDMQGFVKAINAVQPHAPLTFRPSLLPAAYEKDTVIAEFSGILRGLVSGGDGQQGLQ